MWRRDPRRLRRAAPPGPPAPLRLPRRRRADDYGDRRSSMLAHLRRPSIGATDLSNQKQLLSIRTRADARAGRVTRSGRNLDLVSGAYPAPPKWTRGPSRDALPRSRPVVVSRAESSRWRQVAVPAVLRTTSTGLRAARKRRSRSEQRPDRPAGWDARRLVHPPAYAANRSLFSSARAPGAYRAHAVGSFARRAVRCRISRDPKTHLFRCCYEPELCAAVTLPPSPHDVASA